uniref:Uncharacterized protein n=1 Tax=Oryza punctata TaxID=4537 RepID=A0A0E0K3C4_ORYPU
MTTMAAVERRGGCEKATDVLYVNHQECKEVSFVEVAVPASSPDVECPFLSTPLLPLPECLNLALLPRWQCYGSSFMLCFTSLYYLFFDRAVPGRPTVPREWPKHGPVVGLGRHEHDPSRAVPCLGWAAGLGPYGHL